MLPSSRFMGLERLATPEGLQLDADLVGVVVLNQEIFSMSHVTTGGCMDSGLSKIRVSAVTGNAASRREQGIAAVKRFDQGGCFLPNVLNELIEEEHRARGQAWPRDTTEIVHA
jgi:hypothetical protein